MGRRLKSLQAVMGGCRCCSAGRRGGRGGGVESHPRGIGVANDEVCVGEGARRRQTEKGGEEEFSHDQFSGLTGAAALFAAERNLRAAASSFTQACERVPSSLMRTMTTS